MSLQDPFSKMSKSDPNEKSRILLDDPHDVIVKKVKSAVTDSDRYVRYDWEEKAGISNLLELFSIFSGRTIDSLVDEFHETGYGTFKIAAAEAIAEGLAPVRERMSSIEDGDVMDIMTNGAVVAREKAEEEMTPIRAAVGLG